MTSDYEAIVAHYCELMQTYEAGTPEHIAYEYICSMLSRCNGSSKEAQRERVCVVIHLVESFPWHAFQTEGNQADQQRKRAVYTEVVKSLKHFLARSR